MSVVENEPVSSWNSQTGHLTGKRLKRDWFWEDKLEFKDATMASGPQPCGRGRV